MAEMAVTRGERTHETILQAAYQLFLELGYHGTSMRQIAKRAKIALGGIYNHFSSKEEIFSVVLVENHPFYNILPAMEAAHGETVEEYVRDVAAIMVAELGERLDFINLMFIELVEFNGKHLPELFQAFFPKIMEFADRLSQRKGILRSIPPPIMTRAFIGLFFSYLITELMIGKFFPPESSGNALNYLVDIYLYGILAEDDTRPGQTNDMEYRI